MFKDKPVIEIHMHYIGDRDKLCEALQIQYARNKKYHYFNDKLELKVFKDKVVIGVSNCTGIEEHLLWLARVLLVLSCNDIRYEVYHRKNKINTMSKVIRYKEEQ